MPYLHSSYSIYKVTKVYLIILKTVEPKKIFDLVIFTTLWLVISVQVLLAHVVHNCFNNVVHYRFNNVVQH